MVTRVRRKTTSTRIFEALTEILVQLPQIIKDQARQRDTLHHLHGKVNWLMTAANASQADIDALTDQVTQDRTAIATVVAKLNALIAAGQPVQVAALQAAVSGLTSDIAADAGPTP